MSKGKFMILEANPMVKEDNGEPVGGMFRYSSIAGMLIYLSGDTHPDVSLAVGICVRYMFSPKCSYKLTSKIFVGYLKQTKDCGLVLNYNYDVCKVYAYAGVDFSGMFGHEKPKYTAFLNRCTGFIVTFVDYPVLWVSKLHTDTALLTTEAEIITMAHCCRELFLVIDVSTSLGKALILDRTFPHQFTPRRMSYMTRTNWFGEDIVKHVIKLLRIDTV